MTTNVPQDDELLIAMRRILPYIKDPTAYLHAEESIRRAELRAQRQQGAEPVGAAVASPDDPGFTIASFEASDVPAGTMLFTQQHPVRESGEAVAYLDYNGELKPTRHGIITMKKGDNLYTTPPQANALVAAALKVAAAKLDDLSEGGCTADWFRAKCSVLTVTPADAEAALREVCMKVAKSAILAGMTEANHECTGREDIKRADAESIVNSIIGASDKVEGGK
jgi:hypothetical protein